MASDVPSSFKENGIPEERDGGEDRLVNNCMDILERKLEEFTVPDSPTPERPNASLSNIQISPLSTRAVFPESSVLPSLTTPTLGEIPLTPREPPPFTAPPLEPAESPRGGLGQWTSGALRFARRLVSGRAPSPPRTIDAEIEASVTELRATQQRYLELLRLTGELFKHLRRSIVCQLRFSRVLEEMASEATAAEAEEGKPSEVAPSLVEVAPTPVEMAPTPVEVAPSPVEVVPSPVEVVPSPNGTLSPVEPAPELPAPMMTELCEEMALSVNAQKTLVNCGNTLLKTLNVFLLTLDTLCNKTMVDTLGAVAQYEEAREEFDVSMRNMEIVKTDHSAVNAVWQSANQGKQQVAREKYERLRGILSVKLQLLNDNKVTVMHRQLLLLNRAVMAYFSGDQESLEDALDQFNRRVSISSS